MADNLVTLTAPNGATVKVSKERAKSLLAGGGYAESGSKSTPKSTPKVSSSKSSK